VVVQIIGLVAVPAARHAVDRPSTATAQKSEWYHYIDITFHKVIRVLSYPNANAVGTGLCPRSSEGPLFGIVSRLVHQKGLDLVAGAANDIVENGGQIAIPGMGDPEIEHMLSRTSRRHRDNIGLLIGFNEPTAPRIVAGSDFTLMPSRFEPCGLTQMQAQRYGALPIAHATGGLADTINDGTTGFSFSTSSPDGLMEACHRAFDAYGDEA
jgi:starch synthase